MCLYALACRQAAGGRFFVCLSVYARIPAADGAMQPPRPCYGDNYRPEEKIGLVIFVSINSQNVRYCPGDFWGRQSAFPVPLSCSASGILWGWFR